MRFARHKVHLIDYQQSINLIVSIESNLPNQTVYSKSFPKPIATAS